MDVKQKLSSCNEDVLEEIEDFFSGLGDQEGWDEETVSRVSEIGRGCKKRGDCRDAIERVSMHLRQAAECYEGWVLLGALRDQIGETEEAIGALRQGFAIAARREEWEVARRLQERMAACDGEAALTVVSEAELQVARGQCEEAVSGLMEKAEEMLQEGKRQEFLVLGRNILSMDGDCEAIRKAMGEALVAEAKAFVNYGLDHQALEALCEAVAYRPEQLDIYASMAKVMIGSADLGEAVTVIEERARCCHDEEKKEVWERFAGRLEEYVDAARRDEEKTVVVDEAGVRWPLVSGDISTGLGQEETSPVFQTREVTRRIEEWDGPSVHGESWVANAVSLLALVDRLDELSRVTLWDEETEEIRGSFFVENGRLAVGVQVEGEAFDGGSRFEEEERKKLKELWLRYGVRSESDEERQGSPSVSERVLVEVANAAALERWAKLGRETRLRTSVKALSDRKGPGLVNRPRSLLLRLGRGGLSDESGAQFEMGPGLAKVKRRCGWLIEVEEQGWLVWKYEGNGSPTFETLVELMKSARDMAGGVKRVFPEQDVPGGWAWMGGDGALGAMRRGDRMMIVETPSRGVGALLKAIEAHKLASED